MRWAVSVGCKCPPPPLKQYPAIFLKFIIGWNSYVLNHHVVGGNARSIESYYVREKGYAVNQAFEHFIC